MPKIYEYLGIIIMFYSNEHEPIDVHGNIKDMNLKQILLLKTVLLSMFL
jgi:hypothetical protein